MITSLLSRVWLLLRLAVFACNPVCKHSDFGARTSALEKMTIATRESDWPYARSLAAACGVPFNSSLLRLLAFKRETPISQRVVARARFLRRHPKASQLIIIGAGYDTFGLHLPLRVVEVDHPSILDRKRLRLLRQRMDLSNTTYVSVNYAAKDIESALADHVNYGQVIVVMEGVGPYLLPKQLAELLAALQRALPPSTPIFCDVVKPEPVREFAAYSKVTAGLLRCAVFGSQTLLGLLSLHINGSPFQLDVDAATILNDLGIKVVECLKIEAEGPYKYTYNNMRLLELETSALP
ncbi:MAG: uncharacterized protein KVP18_002939 [Porospora cf. gigantea A]|uniref:uncharacterized protein n=1 Tax=Porospora cf. gigantea A TaxID=2853593 RepID=UPI00355A84C6|nr:MAG: hypothetical protein KVP18_002939 [Porospora cf. gigantea A]